MKSHYSVLFAVALLHPSHAQSPTPPAVVVEETVVQPVQVRPPVVTEEIVTQPVDPGVPPLRPLDPTVFRRQLSTVPKAVPAHPPGTVVETTETTLTRNIPGQPPRVYNLERSVVIVEGRELPYITIPVLFVKETAELLDTESRAAIEQTATAIREAVTADPTAVFDIEGHTSTDGTAEFNLDLSAQRAKRIFEELTVRYQIPATVLSAHGYGENYPSYPAGTEEQMTLDRRVLVVRVK